MTLLADLSWPRETSRLTIRLATADDAAAVWSWRQDPAVSQWLTRMPTSAEDHARLWAEGVDTSLVAFAGGKLVATGKVAQEDAWAQDEVADRAHGRQAELGWVVSPECQGQGLGTEFARALLDIAFDTGVRRVTAACFADNLASARIMAKIGMHEEARFRADSLHRSGQWMDSLLFAILDTDPR